MDTKISAFSCATGSFISCLVFALFHVRFTIAKYRTVANICAISEFKSSFKNDPQESVYERVLSICLCLLANGMRYGQIPLFIVLALFICECNDKRDRPLRILLIQTMMVFLEESSLFLPLRWRSFTTKSGRLSGHPKP